MNNYDYIINAFTQDGNNVNEEIDNLTVGCITAKNNSFELDSQGNLTVRTLTQTSGTGSLNLLDVYPVGSIYMSVNNADPGTLFGGTWEALGGRFLVGANSTYPAGNTGGNSTHAHSIPNHNHGLSSGYAEVIIRNTNLGVEYNEKTTPTWQANYVTRGGNGYTNYANHNYGAALGGSTDNKTNLNTNSSSSLPPYLSVYMWKRIS